MLKFLDTFAGIGGFRVAAESLGLECSGAIEWDADCQATYFRNFGDLPLGDITAIAPEDVPKHDILFGGFPCQAFSRNGKYNHNSGKVSETDSRKDLYKCLVEILKVHQPKAFIFENVKELTSIKDLDGNLFIDQIKSDLKDAGYKLTFKVLNSQDFGLPQQRFRVYFVGLRNDIEGAFEFPEKYIDKKYIKDILESEVDPKYLLSNRWQEWKIALKRPDKANHSQKMGSPRLEALKEIYGIGHPPRASAIKPVSIIYGDTPSGLPRQQDKLYSIEGVSPTLVTFELTVPAFAITSDPQTWRVLTPRECARVQGFPDTYKVSDKDSVAYKQTGNAVSPPVVKNILESLLKFLT